MVQYTAPGDTFETERNDEIEQWPKHGYVEQVKGARKSGGPKGPPLPTLVVTCYLLSDTLIASTPLSFIRGSYVTRASIGSVVLSPTMLLRCTKRFPPSLGAIQPYPLSASKVLTIPFFKRKTPP